MPSHSQKQHDFMELVLRDKKFAEKAKVDQKVAKEFLDADRKADLWQKPDTVVKLPSGYRFRKLDIKQVDAYVEFRQIASEESDYTNNQTKERATALINKLGTSNFENGYVIVEEKTGRIIGDLFYKYYFDEDYFYVSKVTLLEEFQGKKKQFSDGLMEQAIALAKDKFFPEIRLYVSKKNKKALAYYKRHGFVYLKDYDANNEVYHLVLYPETKHH